MTEPEKHSMAGWGKRVADFDEPRTQEEAAFTAQIIMADRLLEILTTLQNIQTRLFRLESWLEEYMPGYRFSSAYKAEPGDTPSPGPQPGPRPAESYPRALRGVKIT